MLRTLSDRTTGAVSGVLGVYWMSLTFIFPYVLEGECEASVLSLDYANLAESSFANHAQ